MYYILVHRMSLNVFTKFKIIPGLVLDHRIALEIDSKKAPRKIPNI